jgi:flagellar basal body L-ring protein FlgH
VASPFNLCLIIRLKLKGNQPLFQQKRKSEVEDQEKITSILVREETLSDKSNSSNEMRLSISLQGARDVLLKTYMFKYKSI